MISCIIYIRRLSISHFSFLSSVSPISPSLSPSISLSLSISLPLSVSLHHLLYVSLPDIIFLFFNLSQIQSQPMSLLHFLYRNLSRSIYPSLHTSPSLSPSVRIGWRTVLTNRTVQHSLCIAVQWNRGRHCTALYLRVQDQKDHIATPLPLNAIPPPPLSLLYQIQTHYPLN